ncbi:MULTISPECIES: EthD domain-containing protein [Burkholderia]|nr:MULTISPECIES: EthD domain-containing protein [Burkholderia]
MKLIIAVKRKPGFTREQFIEYLSETHAAIVRGCPASHRYVRKYVQSYTLQIGIDGKPMEPSLQEYDAVSELWFDSIEDVKSFFSDPEYLASVHPDEARFSDRDKCVFFITEERQII